MRKAKHTHVLLLRMTRSEDRELRRLARHHGAPRVVVLRDLIHAEICRLGLLEASPIDQAIEAAAQKIVDGNA